METTITIKTKFRDPHSNFYLFKHKTEIKKHSIETDLKAPWYVVWMLTQFLKVQNVDFGMGYHFSPKLNKNVPKGIIKQKN